MADPFHIGIIEALFKVLEERVAFGKQITTFTSVLIVFGVIVFILQFLIAALLVPIGTAGPIMVAMFHLLTGNRILPELPSAVKLILLNPFVWLFFPLILLVFLSYRGEVVSVRRDNELLKRIRTLEKVVGAENNERT